MASLKLVLWFSSFFFTSGCQLAAVNLSVTPGTRFDQTNFVDISKALHFSSLTFHWDLSCDCEHSCETGPNINTPKVILKKFNYVGSHYTIFNNEDVFSVHSTGNEYKLRDYALTHIQLESSSRYIWQVCFPTLGCSAVETFKTTVEQGDWNDAAWIGGGTLLQGRIGPYNKQIVESSVYATGIGCFSITLNSKLASSSVLDPGFSTIPPFRLLYRAIEVTDLLNTGIAANNTIVVKMGM